MSGAAGFLGGSFGLLLSAEAIDVLVPVRTGFLGGGGCGTVLFNRASMSFIIFALMSATPPA